MTNIKFDRTITILAISFLLLLGFVRLSYSDYEARVPRHPSGLEAVAKSSTTIDINWCDNADDEDGFRLYRSRGFAYTMIADLGPNTTSYHDTDLKPGTTYYYIVKAYNEAGESAPSNEDYATTFQDPPAAPSGLDARAVSSTKIYLNWQDNAANEDGFKIYRDEGYGFIQIANLSKNTNFYCDSGLKPGTKYWYKVTSYNAAGESDYSNTDWAVTLR
jgi:fibronectin type 3 domain-containing protein